MQYAITVIGTLLVLSACKTGHVREDVPARVINPTTESHAALKRVLSDALNGRDVTIADDALSNDSLLVIEPAHLMGRDLRKPEQFRLVRSGSTCVLVHLGSDERYELGDTDCAPE